MTVRLVEHGSHSRCLGYMPGVANQLNSSKASLFLSRFEAQIEKIMIINKNCMRVLVMVRIAGKPTTKWPYVSLPCLISHVRNVEVEDGVAALAAADDASEKSFQSSHSLTQTRSPVSRPSTD